MRVGSNPRGAAATALLEKDYDGWKVTHYEPAYYYEDEDPDILPAYIFGR